MADEPRVEHIQRPDAPMGIPAVVTFCAIPGFVFGVEPNLPLITGTDLCMDKLILGFHPDMEPGMFSCTREVGHLPSMLHVAHDGETKRPILAWEGKP